MVWWFEATYQMSGGTADCMEVVISRTIKVLVLEKAVALRCLSKYLE